MDNLLLITYSHYREESTMTHKDRRCIICGQLHIDGIRIRGKLICTLCEKDIITTEVDEKSYQDLQEEVKTIWSKDTAYNFQSL